VKGRVAFITGAGSGINRGTARLLAADGYKIAAVDLNGDAAKVAATELTEIGAEALGLQADVADRASVRAAVADTVKRFGRVDVLVSGAGFVQNAPFLELEESAWDRMIDVHLKGAFNTSQAVLPHMKAEGFGRIVCISSMAAINGTVNHSHYAAAKAGVLGFVRALAKDIGPWGITINAVVPGAVDTPLVAGISPERFKRLSDTPVGRVGKVEDIAYAIRYLVSEEAGYVTGAHLRISGGL
jgi:NAD(P)-dependent dehydrogenase (short-subunit alcohol dehydrogenase family)